MNEEFVRALRANDIPKIQAMIHAGADVNAVIDAGGNTALHIVAGLSRSRNVLPILKVLLDAGADVNKKASIGGDTPLFVAIEMSRPREYSHSLDVVKELLRRGANVNIATNRMETPLHEATDAMVSIDFVTELLKYHPNLEAKTLYQGRTALHFAVHSAITNKSWQAQLEKVKLLIRAGADVNAKDNLGNTPLHYITGERVNGRISIARLLLNAGADPDKRNDDGDSPLDKAERNELNTLATLMTKRSKRPKAQSKTSTFLPPDDMTDPITYDSVTKARAYYIYPNAQAGKITAVYKKKTLQELMRRQRASGQQFTSPMTRRHFTEDDVYKLTPGDKFTLR